MASLLERMNVPVGGLGPVRTKSGQGNNRKSSPYNRPPKGDTDSAWSHDMFEQHNSLSARLNISPTAPKANLSNNNMLGKALQAATGSGLSIKGAGTASQGNVVEVSGLVTGTTSDDVVAIFKRCGEIVKAASLPGKEVTIRVTFKNPSGASAAVQKFHNQPADGKTLSVRIVGSNSTSLGGRLGGPDGLGLVREEGSVDVLMESAESGSKMRSDSLTADPRAQVLVAPPGANPKDYVQAPGGRGGFARGGRGRNRGNRHKGGKRGGKMDVD
ncbi:Proline dehydrogenase [Mycena indigotica]|uniref:Proline dehydrogenase n=1 Tax=Mycena indigotica TaxID=2126181 RepID=A0A8H6WFW8_9AGAR|nr:Proline dehydrogenase [Mycena indigotica]KAF7315196.1 Proline dehydrogenase [Mycena indigotica]